MRLTGFARGFDVADSAINKYQENKRAQENHDLAKQRAADQKQAMDAAIRAQGNYSSPGLDPNGDIFMGADSPAAHAVAAKQAADGTVPAIAPMRYTDSDRAMTAMRLASAAGDTDAFKAASSQMRAARISDITSTVMRMADADVMKQVSLLNTNDSNVPMVVGMPDKQGNVKAFVTGEGGAATRELNLTPIQMRQMVLSNELANAGFGDEAFRVGTAVDKQVAEMAFKRTELANKRLQADRQYDVQRGNLAVAQGNLAVNQQRATNEAASADRNYGLAERGMRVREADLELRKEKDKNGGGTSLYMRTARDGGPDTIYDTKTKRPLYRQDGEGNIIPLNDNPMQTDAKAAALAKSAGITSQPRRMPDGTVVWGYFVPGDPEPYASLDAAMAGAKSAKPTKPAMRGAQGSW